MKLHVLNLSLVTALVLGTPLTSIGADKKAKATPAPTAEASPAATPANPDKPLPYRGIISAADKDAKTFTIQNKEGARVFKVGADTVITKGADAPATWDDIKVGEQVRGSAKKTGEGQYEAVKVKLGPKEKGAEKPAKKAKQQ